MANFATRKALAEEIRKAIESEDQRNPNDLTELNRITQQWAEANKQDDKLLDDAYHSLIHFLTDRDIRLKDTRYADRQIAAMRQLVTELESS
jgi:hypothetical protein